MKEVIMSRELVLVQVYILISKGETEDALAILYKLEADNIHLFRNDLCRIKTLELLGQLHNAVSYSISLSLSLSS